MDNLEQQFLQRATATLYRNLNSLDEEKAQQVRDILRDAAYCSSPSSFRLSNGVLTARKLDHEEQMLTYASLERVVAVAGKETLQEQSWFGRMKHSVRDAASSLYSLAVGKEKKRLDTKEYTGVIEAFGVGVEVKKEYTALVGDITRREQQIASLEGEFNMKKRVAMHKYLETDRILLAEKRSIELLYEETPEAKMVEQLDLKYGVVKKHINHIYNNALEGITRFVGDFYTGAFLEKTKLIITDTPSAREALFSYAEKLKLQTSLTSEWFTKQGVQEGAALIDGIYEDVAAALRESTTQIRRGIHEKKEKQTLKEEVEEYLFGKIQEAFTANIEQRRRVIKQQLFTQGIGDTYARYQEIKELLSKNTIQFDHASLEIESIERDRLVPGKELLDEKLAEVDSFFFATTAQLANTVLQGAPRQLTKQMYHSLGFFDQQRYNTSFVNDLKTIFTPPEEKKSWLATRWEHAYASASAAVDALAAIPKKVYGGVTFAAGVAFTLGTLLGNPAIPTNQSDAGVPSLPTAQLSMEEPVWTSNTIKALPNEILASVAPKRDAGVDEKNNLSVAPLPLEEIVVPQPVRKIEPSVAQDPYFVISIGAGAQVVTHGSQGELYQNGTWVGNFSIVGVDNLARALTSSEYPQKKTAEYSGKRSLLEQQASQNTHLPKMY